jgi:hypothetical protein
MEKQIILSKNVRVSDPCYTDDVWCKTQLTNVLPGAYNWSVSFNDTSGWGHRVSGITLIHESFDDDDSIEWQYHSEIGVDSGQAGIFCETSYRNDEVASGITTPDVDFGMPDGGEGEKWYTKMCKFTLSEDSYGAYDTGLVSSSGIGDGQYPLYVAYDKDNNIIAMKIEIDYLLDDEDGDICGVCGGDLESDGTCDYCQQEECVGCGNDNSNGESCNCKN